MSKRAINSLIAWRVGLVFLAFAFAVGVGCNGEPSDNLDSRLHEQMGQADFEPAQQLSEQLLAILVDVTKTNIVARETGLELILGQQKTSSAIADLQISVFANGGLLAQYHAPDPRFSKVENGDWIETGRATMRIFVPLSNSIDKVSVEPVPGRESVVSTGGHFDPRPLMKLACAQAAGTGQDIYFPRCHTFGLIVTP